MYKILSVDADKQSPIRSFLQLNFISGLSGFVNNFDTITFVYAIMSIHANQVLSETQFLFQACQALVNKFRLCYTRPSEPFGTRFPSGAMVAKLKPKILDTHMTNTLAF